MAPITFPVEIWISILDYLSEENLKYLYAVNKPCLERGLDARYRRVNLVEVKAYPDLESLRRYLLHLLEPHIICRIRCFELQSLGLTQLYFQDEKVGASARFRMASKLPSSLGARLHPDVRNSSLLGLIRQIISEAPGVESLAFNAPGVPNSLSGLLPVAIHALHMLAGRLKTLILHGAISLLPHLLRQTSTHQSFVRLQNLELKITNDMPPEADPKSVEEWSSFLRHISPNLVSIDVETGSSSYFTGPVYHQLFSQIMRHLQSAHQLEVVAIKPPGEITWVLVPHLTTLLERNPTALKEVDIPPCGASQVPQRTLKTIRSLTLREPWRSPPNNPDSFLLMADSYLSCCSSLTSLSLFGVTLRFEALEHLLRKNWTRPSAQTLRRLDITITSIHPQLFITMASTLPNLQDLVIRPTSGVVSDACLSDMEGAGMSSSKRFAAAEWRPGFLVHSPLAAWHLEYIRVESPKRSRFIVEGELIEVLHHLIPSLVYEITVVQN